MVETMTSILVVDMLGSIVHKHCPFFATPWIFGYAILNSIHLKKFDVKCLFFYIFE